MVIGFGSIWGLFMFGGMLLSSFTIGSNDSWPEVLAILLNGLTILPSCILAIWFTKPAALWLMLLTPITAFGLAYEILHLGSSASEIAWALVVALIPGAIGLLLFRSQGEMIKRVPAKSEFR